MDARPEFAEVERLGDIVVRADLEADHAIDRIARRGEHDDRSLAARPDTACDRKAILAGEVDVEDQQVRRTIARQRVQFETIARKI